LDWSINARRTQLYLTTQAGRIGTSTQAAQLVSNATLLVQAIAAERKLVAPTQTSTRVVAEVAENLQASPYVDREPKDADRTAPDLAFFLIFKKL